MCATRIPPIAAALAKMQANGGQVAFDAAALIAEYNAKFGLDQPLWNQYLNYWSDLAHGDLGACLIQCAGHVLNKVPPRLIAIGVVLFILNRK